MNEKNLDGKLNWKDLKVLSFPNWYKEEFSESKHEKILNKIIGKRTRYEDYSISQLRSVYMDLEGDLRTLIPEYSGITNEEERKNADEIGNYIINLLNAAKGMLENQKLGKRQMLIVSTLLQEIEECLVWITPHALAYAHMDALSLRIAELDSHYRDKYQEMLKGCKNFLEGFMDKYEKITRNETENYRARLEEVIRFINTESLKSRINIGLQIERLRTLKFWGWILLFVLIITFPFFSNTYITNGNNTNAIAWKDLFQFSAILFKNNLLVAYTAAISFAVVGGIGGFLSGLLQMRGSKTNLGDYEMSILLFQLRPIFGAFAALILAALLSWGVLSDVIKNESLGTFILAAFVSGFSERYFLNLLKLDQDESLKQDLNKELDKDLDTEIEKALKKELKKDQKDSKEDNEDMTSDTVKKTDIEGGQRTNAAEG